MMFPSIFLLKLSSSQVSLKKKIIDFIQTLDTDTKTTFILREVEGRTYDEIAEILNCPIGTVRSRIFRARQLILEFIDQENILNE
jgi:RNA polymerase sigma-70 factor (ECF subfamily)